MYEGFLVKIGNWPVPNDYIEPAGYKTSDSPEKVHEWYDCENGRHVIYSSNTVPVIQFSTPKNFSLKDEDIDLIRESLSAAMNEDGSYKMTFYSMIEGIYKTANMTLETLTFPVYGVSDDDVFCRGMDFKFKGV